MHRRHPATTALALTAALGLGALAIGGCGKRRSQPTAAAAAIDAASAATTVADAGAAPVAAIDAGAAPVAVAPVDRDLGLLSLDGFDDDRVDGKPEQQLRRARRARDAADWPALEAAATAVLSAVPDHLEAHRMLAGALARQGKLDGVGPHLQIALAGDWARFGPGLDQQPDLERYFASPTFGPAARTMNEALRARFAALVDDAVLLVHRRKPFAAPTARGLRAVPPGGELFAYLPASKRFLQLTHTGGRVATAVRSPDGASIVYAGWSKLKVAAGAPTLLAPAQVGILTLRALVPEPPEATFDEVRGLELRFRKSGALVVGTYGPRDSLAEPPTAYFAVALQTGAKSPGTPVGGEPAHPPPVGGEGYAVVAADAAGRSDQARARVRFAYDRLITSGPWDDAAPPERRELVDGLPDKRQAGAHLRWSPTRRRLALIAVGDRCAAAPVHPEARLYAIDAQGNAGHVELAHGDDSYAFTWLDDDQIALEGDTPGLRVVDAATGKPLPPIAVGKGTLSLRGLVAPLDPRCLHD